MKIKLTLLAALSMLGCFTATSQAAAAPTLYGSAYSGNTGPATLYTMNASTGTATPVGAIGFARVGALEFPAFQRHPLRNRAAAQ